MIIQKRKDTGAKPYVVVGAILGGLMGMIGLSNVYTLKEGDSGEFMKNGKKVSATTKPGFHFTKPFSGTEFVKWSNETKKTVEGGATLDGQAYVATVSVDYKVPSTYQMEDYSTLHHLFTTGVGQAFSEVVNASSSQDIKRSGISAAEFELCEKISKLIPNTKEGNSVKNPANLTCKLVELKK